MADKGFKMFHFNLLLLDSLLAFILCLHTPVVHHQCLVFISAFSCFYLPSLLPKNLIYSNFIFSMLSAALSISLIMFSLFLSTSLLQLLFVVLMFTLILLIFSVGSALFFNVFADSSYTSSCFHKFDNVIPFSFHFIVTAFIRRSYIYPHNFIF